MKFFRAIFWEFVQNLPLIAGFIIAFQFWRHGQWVQALVASLVGSLTGALMIRATESKIVSGHREPIRLVITNSLSMAALALGLIAYLLIPWSTWKTDLVAGVLVGILLGITQSVAAREPIGVRHCAALACSFPIALISFRTLIAFNRPAWENILILTAVVTLIISAVDYGPLYFGRAQSGSRL